MRLLLLQAGQRNLDHAPSHGICLLPRRVDRLEIRNNTDPFLGLVVAACHAAEEIERKPRCDGAEAFERATMGHGNGRQSGHCTNVGVVDGCSPTVALQSLHT